MGRLVQEPSIQHFSHPHPLQLTSPQTLTLTLTNATPCSGCELQSSGWTYTCKPCNFTLHVSCAQMTRLINHPSHPSHPLTLLPTPPYPGGVFRCDGCGSHGRGFSFHCIHCDFDVHMLCATKPLFLVNGLHAHKLELTFDPPYQTKGFSCDICRKLGSNHWLYRCSSCEFDAHLDCASNVTNAPQAQTQTHNLMKHYNSFPGGYQVQNGNFRPGGVNNFPHSQSMGSLQNPQVGMPGMNNNVNGNYYAPPTNGNFLHSQSMATYQNSQPINGNALANAAVQAFMEGAAISIGQNFMQSVMNDGSGGGNGGDPGGNNGGGDSSSMMGFGSSILSGVFGDSSSETQS